MLTLWNIPSMTISHTHPSSNPPHIHCVSRFHRLRMRREDDKKTTGQKGRTIDGNIGDQRAHLHATVTLCLWWLRGLAGAFAPLICIGHQIALPMHRHSVSLRLMKANVAHPTDVALTADLTFQQDMCIKRLAFTSSQAGRFSQEQEESH